MRLLTPEWHAVLPSTNEWLCARLRRGDPVPPGTVVVARQQTAGRGRRGRVWLAAPGEDLTFSVAVRAPATPQQALAAPMAAALGVAAAVEAMCGLAPRVKWPNDVLLSGRKLGGILGEHAGDMLVVGIGLNVNMDAETAAGIGRPAVSLSMATGRRYALEEVLAGVLDRLGGWLTRWEEGGFPAIRSEWVRRCAGLGEPAAVQDGARRLSGRLVGFGAWGQALLARPDGTVAEAWAGEIEADGGHSRRSSAR